MNKSLSPKWAPIENVSHQNLSIHQGAIYVIVSRVKANVYSKCQFYNQITTRSTQIRRKRQVSGILQLIETEGRIHEKYQFLTGGALSLFRVLCILRSIHMKNILLIVEV
ncbi:uncharacterized protein PHALS_07606 [Plasmopara halstedii]|uniref:Uncharacterized protein n=1 Tax=Plasmopara halstedii TaxID=4781 RepID=A0A0P1B527_PLAHL|nr:uncharacterized protein PHALS_07606 [Plasmopara halstedii]CEG49866.1 hypothetical protein PHALS_07606 [Plasmopara halstedii]|eukprot:XP_024586235.1 hypothetical protein PHALS_07606 [Plasmopara halstedii]